MGTALSTHNVPPTHSPSHYHPFTYSYGFDLLFYFGLISGWQWSPLDRPSFAETHQAFETMFHDSSISEGTCTTVTLLPLRLKQGI